MGATEGETAAADSRGSEEPESAPAQDTLQVPAQKKRKLKSPTPGSLRGRSATPIRGRSQTPFTLYMTRRSATPSSWRSITPFLKREEKEKTPFELGRDLKTLLTCNTAVFDRALVMDISEPLDVQKPVRYITSDMSVIDRAAVMDVSNVEVIYVVEEYEEYEEEEEEIIVEEVKPKKKKGARKGRTPRKSADKDMSPSELGSEAEDADAGEDREDSVDVDEGDEPVKKGKKKGAAKKKEKKEKSPSPKLSLKLEMGGGQKASKKMFEDKQQQPAGPGPKPPPKKSKLALQMEEQAKAAAKAAEEEAAKAAAKPKAETFEERQKRLKAEEEERQREEEERRLQEEAELAEMEEEANEDEAEDFEGSSRYDDGTSRFEEDFEEEHEDEEMDEVGELPSETRRSSSSSEGFTRPDPDDMARWQQIAEEEGEEFMQQMRKYSLAVRKSEKQRDEEWKRRREQMRLPHFVVFLSDRTVEAGHNVRLACAVGGPELSVKWFKDGRQLERDATHRIINNNNILALEVVNTTILDSGEYSCVIANSNDEVTSSCYVTIYEVFKDQPSPPSFRLVREYYHLRDDELTIEVHVHGVPRPVITWWRGAFEIKPNVKFTKLEEAHGVYKLLIYKPNNRDSGPYTCKAFNSSGEAETSHTVEVAKNLHYHVPGIFNVRNRLMKNKEELAKKAMEEAMKSKEDSDKKRAAVDSKSRAPRASPEPMVSPKQKLKFATQLRDRMALEGSNIKFACTVIGPTPNCRWMKDDKWVVYGDSIKNHTEEGKAVIELLNVTSEASGVYKCVARNDVSEIETSCYFKVYPAQADGDEHEPIFALPLRDVYHSSQNDLILDTKIRGNPRPVITWIKDQIPVVLDDRIVQIEHLDGICELIINKPTPNDSGNYTCVAQNKLGSQQTSHSVLVEQVHGSRRSSVLSSGAMSESDSQRGRREGGGGDKEGRPPKSKKKDDEGDVTYERRSRMPEPPPKMQLYFTVGLSNRYVAIGSKVKLQAVVNGPDATMKWQKDGQNVTFGPRVRNLNREGLAVLDFQNCQLEDSGVYSVTASNEYCKVITTATLHVYSPSATSDIEPVFVRPIKDTYHLNTNELILETGVRGVPTPKVQWLKDNIDIEDGGRFHIFNHADGTCELIIDAPNIKDKGKYIVRAESSVGKAEVTHLVHFEGKEHHIADNIHGVFHADKSLLKPKQVEEEKPKAAAAPAEGGEGGSEAGSKGKRKARQAKRDDDSEAEAASSAYATDTGSETGSLKKREKVIGIYFPTSLKDRVVAEGSKVKISCVLESKEPQVKWFKNDEPLQNSPKCRGRYNEGLCILEIPSAAVEDSGEYKCWARDETGEASTFCRLEVFSDPGTGDVPPTFTRNIKDTYHGKLHELQLDVHVRGLPTPTVTWVKDGVQIEPSEKYQQVDHDDGTCELFIMDPTPNDSGKYVCQAENREGKAEIVHPVVVQPRVRRPVSPSKDRPPVKPMGEETEEEKEARRKKKEEDEEGSRRREVPPPPDLKKRIYFRNFLSNRTVKEGTNVKWMVSIDGPDPTAKWFHGETPIVFGPKSKMSMQEGIAWLQLVGVTEEDSGDYTLRVKGSENEIVSTCNLFVYGASKEDITAPVFVQGIKDAYHSHDNRLTLECKVSGQPKPSVYWQKDNTLLPEQGKKYTYVDLPEGVKQLLIENPDKTDTGLYTCYAESDSGQMKISKFVDISDYVQKITDKKVTQLQKEEDTAATTREQPSQDENDEKTVEDRRERKTRSKEAKFKLNVETPMKPMTMAAGTKAQLICYITGLIEDVYWLRDDERVTKDSRHKIYNINGALSLEIYDARPDDTAEYKCVVKNSRNTVDCKCDLLIYDSAAQELPPSFASPIEATFDAERCEIVLSSNVHGRPNVTWIRDDHTISNNRYRVVEEIGGVRKLIIRNPIPSDCGTFSCFAETNERIESITKVIKTSDLKKMMAAAAETEMNGYAAPHQIAQDDRRSTSLVAADTLARTSVARSHVVTQRKPLFSSLLHDRTVTEGGNIRLSCSVVYDGNTKIEWLKNHRSLPNDDRYHSIFHNGEAILEIVAAEERDSGHYICRASNDYGETVTQSNIRIYKHYEDALQPTTFVQSIRDTYSLNENELVLDCRVRGKPRPEIQWLKGSEILIPGEKYRQIDQEDGYSKLVINNPTEKDSGLYGCLARNEAAESKITHQVDFKGRERFTQEKTLGFYHRDPNKPHLITPLGNQTVCGGGTIAISAEFMQTSTPIEVQWYRGRQALAGQPDVKTFYEKGVYTLAIMNATPEIEGTYTCRAQNAFGRIESHATVDVAVGVEKAERPPLFLSRPDTEMKIAVGDPFSISFRIAGDPKPKLTLMKGTKDITKSDRVSKEVSDDFTRFAIAKSQIADSGTYFVVARNNNGTDRIFVTVDVMPRARSETPSAPRWGLPLESYPDVSYFKDPPSAISTEPLLVDSGPTHISLSWGKPPGNNSAPVIAYRVDAWIVGHDGGAIWKELGLTPINSFDAFNLKANVEYHFRVTPKNRYGWGPSVQTTQPLQVGGVECLPEFTAILPGQVKALLDKEFVLECVVRGSPRPDIAWFKDGLRVGNNIENERIKTRKIGATCTLTIKRVTEIDAGRYTCEATNSKGRVSTFARLQVVADAKLYEADNRLKEIVRSENISSNGDSLPIFTMRLRDRRVQVTYPVRLTCQVVGYPQPEITWYKDDQLIESNKQCLITHDSQFYTLELASTTLNDSGIYTCTAKNELGSVSCHCSMVVDKGIRAYISPEFYMPLDPLYIVQEGQEIRITAKVEAYPAVGVSWHRNGVKLRPSRRLFVSLDTTGFVELVISEASIRDAGIYTCVASNAVGKAESMCRVCIEPLEDGGGEANMQQQATRSVPAIRTSDMPYSKEPLFVVKPRSSEAYEGDTVIIFCEVVGDPKPDVVWLRDFLNPEYYKDAPHFRRIGEGPEYRLEIPYAKLDFTGTYSVIATNCHGETKAVISLQIFAKDILKQQPMEKGSIRHGNVETLPRFIRPLRNLRCCDGDAITLEAHVEGLPEPVIIWEKDGRVLPSGKDFDMTYDGIKATLRIPRIYPEDEGEYTCVAKNNIGRNLSSACIIVDVPEEKENMLNRQLTRPAALLSTTSTPISTPRSTPNRSFSPSRRMSYRSSVIDISEHRRGYHVSNQAISAPKFFAIPNSRVVEEGDSVRFQCAIAGHPTPWSTWDKDGLIVTPTGRIAVKEVDDLRYLDIDDVCFEDAGLYRITLENDYGRIEATARLDVIPSSRYSKSPSGRSIRASSSRRHAYLHRRIMGPSTAIGGRMALGAGYRGSSVPSCKFYHNGCEIYENEGVHMQLTHEEAFLVIDEVSKDDEGIYTCIIEGEGHDPIVTSTVVKFLPKDFIERGETICKIAKPLPDAVTYNEGEIVDLCFELECNQPYTYTWSRNGIVIKDCEDFNYIDHGNGLLCLRLYDAFDLDSGLYTCHITTSDGCECSTSSNLCIECQSVVADDSGLAVIKSPLPMLADCYGKATFCARVYPPDAQVTWYVCGHQVNENDEAGDDSYEFTLESSPSDGLRILHINNVTLAHSGEVQLYVTHPGKPYSTLKSYTTLAVLPRPPKTIVGDADAGLAEGEEAQQQQEINTKSRTSPAPKDRLHQPAAILEGPTDCTALIGGCVRLSVIFEGLPKPQVVWFKASRPIVESSNIIINTSSRKSILQISDIDTDDSGKYTVEVMNDFGNDVAVASVAVEGPPEPPSGKPSISQGPDRVAIAWCGPPYDGGCMLTGFIIEMQQLDLSANSVQQENETTWLEIASVVDSLAYTVKNLKPMFSYRFRVRAENIHGRSEPGLPSDQVHIAEAGEEPTEDFHKPISVKAGGEFKDRFQILEELGKGRFGVVYKVQEKEDSKRILAAKMIKCIKSRDRVKVQEEISIMKSLKHPKLLQLAASFESPREIVMVMEYITGGELFERVVADDFTLTERDCILFVRQVCEGVAYMHSQSIVHLDLKPENIMCKTRTCHQIKIIDFGLAQRLNTGSPVRVLFGTPEFISPEIISYEPIGFQSDMWSVGVICYVLLSGLSPFMGDTDVETFSNITRAEFDFDDDAFDCVSQQAKDFISNLLVHRKEDRLTAEQCLESPWLKQGHYDENLGNKKICTDKLKKFIIRRKWQKTGNAIRALGRMATLSASRRNSAVSAAGSVPSSPRPSISGSSMFNPNISVQMSSLHEEDDDFSIELTPNAQEIPRRSPKVVTKSQCSERSDSGYSECSNCSASGSLQCQCPSSKDNVDHAATDLQDLLISVPHDLLKLKLEEIAHQADHNVEEAKLELVVPSEQTPQLDANQNELKPLDDLIDSEHPSIPVIEDLEVLNPSSAPLIMRSDFTNTIEMRKKSLENNWNREKPKQANKPPLYDKSGKVNTLKNKFSCMQHQVSSPPIESYVKSKDCMDVLKLKRKVLSEACPNKTASSTTPSSSSSSLQTQYSTSLPNSPIPSRKTFATNTFRLSDRVREVTDRLAQHQTICTEARRTQKSPPLSSNRNKSISP